jgi:hypothetical protein
VARPWRFDSFALDFSPSGGESDTLEHQLRFNVRTLDELEQAEDLRVFAEWVLESDDADFVDEAALGSPGPQRTPT